MIMALVLDNLFPLFIHTKKILFGPKVFSLSFFRGSFVFLSTFFYLPRVDNGGVSMERVVAFGVSYRWLVICDTYHMASYMQYMTSDT